jgi:ABC-type transporter Mla maintaining outer membrane lipid asymmetry ATPase subunit MlaF
MVLHDGRILIEGTAGELFRSKDAYLERFLYRTLPPW